MRLRPQLFIGFLSLTLLILFMGWYGILSLNRIKEITRAMFDGPLMSINFARSAQNDFLRIEVAVSRLTTAADPEQRKSLIEAIGVHQEAFAEDLGIAEERLTSAEGLAAVGRIREAIAQWNSAWAGLKKAYSQYDTAAAERPRAGALAAIKTINEET